MFNYNATAEGMESVRMLGNEYGRGGNMGSWVNKILETHRLEIEGPGITGTREHSELGKRIPGQKHLGLEA